MGPGIGYREGGLWRFAPLGVGLVSLGVGLVKVTKYPWWHDEKITARVANGSFAGIWRAARDTEQPHLLFYVVMKGWFAIIGGPGNHWLARFPSVIWLALTAALLTALGAELFDYAVGAVAGLLVAVNFLLLHWEHFARDLTISLLLVTVATYAFVRMVKSPTTLRWTWIWAVSLLAATWMELFSVALLAGFALAYAVLLHSGGRRPHERLEIALGAGVFALTIPNIVLVATGLNGQLNWIPSLSINQFGLQSWIWAGRNPFTLIACAFGLAVLAVSARRASRQATTWLVDEDAPPVEPWKPALLAGCFAAPIVLILVLSAIHPAYTAQYLFPATPALALLAGVGIVHTRRSIGLPLLAGAVIAGGLLTADYIGLPPNASFSFTP